LDFYLRVVVEPLAGTLGKKIKGFGQHLRDGTVFTIYRAVSVATVAWTPSQGGSKPGPSPIGLNELHAFARLVAVLIPNGI